MQKSSKNESSAKETCWKKISDHVFFSCLLSLQAEKSVNNTQKLQVHSLTDYIFTHFICIFTVYVWHHTAVSNSLKSKLKELGTTKICYNDKYSEPRGSEGEIFSQICSKGKKHESRKTVSVRWVPQRKLLSNIKYMLSNLKKKIENGRAMCKGTSDLEMLTWEL